MRVFISWSGPRSQVVAAALADLLPDAIQGVKTWVSHHDIGAGSRWSQELNAELDASQFAVRGVPVPDVFPDPYRAVKRGLTDR